MFIEHVDDTVINVCTCVFIPRVHHHGNHVCTSYVEKNQTGKAVESSFEIKYLLLILSEILELKFNLIPPIEYTYLFWSVAMCPIYSFQHKVDIQQISNEEIIFLVWGTQYLSGSSHLSPAEEYEYDPCACEVF